MFSHLFSLCPRCVSTCFPFFHLSIVFSLCYTFVRFCFHIFPLFWTCFDFLSFNFSIPNLLHFRFCQKIQFLFMSVPRGKFRGKCSAKPQKVMPRVVACGLQLREGTNCTRLRPTLANPILANHFFGQSFLCCVVWLLVLWLWLLLVLVLVLVLDFHLDHPTPDRLAPDRPAPDLPAPDRPKFRFFFPLPLPFRTFSRPLGVSSLTFGGVYEGRDPQMCTFGLSGCRVKPRWLCGPPLGAPPPLGPTMTHTRSQNGLDKTRLAQIGQIRMAKTGLA